MFDKRTAHQEATRGTMQPAPTTQHHIPNAASSKMGKIGRVGLDFSAVLSSIHIHDGNTVLEHSDANFGVNSGDTAMDKLMTYLLQDSKLHSKEQGDWFTPDVWAGLYHVTLFSFQVDNVSPWQISDKLQSGLRLELDAPLKFKFGRMHYVACDGSEQVLNRERRDKIVLELLPEDEAWQSIQDFVKRMEQQLKGSFPNCVIGNRMQREDMHVTMQKYVKERDGSTPYRKDPEAFKFAMQTLSDQLQDMKAVANCDRLQFVAAGGTLGYLISDRGILVKPPIAVYSVSNQPERGYWVESEHEAAQLGSQVAQSKPISSRPSLGRQYKSEGGYPGLTDFKGKDVFQKLQEEPAYQEFAKSRWMQVHSGSHMPSDLNTIMANMRLDGVTPTSENVRQAHAEHSNRPTRSSGRWERAASHQAASGRFVPASTGMRTQSSHSCGGWRHDSQRARYTETENGAVKMPGRSNTPGSWR